MEYTQVTKQMIDFQKTSFSNWYETIALIQDQAVSAVDMALDQSPWIPEEGRKAVQSWMGAYKEERGRFKSYVDEGFSGIEKFMTESRKTAPTKAQKQEG